MPQLVTATVIENSISSPTFTFSRENCFLRWSASHTIQPRETSMNNNSTNAIITLDSIFNKTCAPSTELIREPNNLNIIINHSRKRNRTFNTKCTMPVIPTNQFNIFDFTDETTNSNSEIPQAAVQNEHLNSNNSTTIRTSADLSIVSRKKKKKKKTRISMPVTSKFFSPNKGKIPETIINEICTDFLGWLKLPASSIFDQIKHRPITNENQLKPTKRNLRFILGLLLSTESGLLPPRNSTEERKLSLSLLIRLDICMRIHTMLDQRKSSSCRKHCIFLLVKKILVFLASKETMNTNTLITPMKFASFEFVNSTCHQESIKRQRDSDNRNLLQGFNASVANNTPTVKRMLSADELKTISHQCLLYLNTFINQHSEAKATISTKLSWKFTKYLVTATFSVMAPRKQILEQLILNQTFIQQNNHFFIKLTADNVKNRKPVLLQIPIQLEIAYKYYLTNIRPLLLKKGATDNNSGCQAVFLNYAGTQARTAFSSDTREISEEIVNFPFSSHSFRHALVGLMYSSGLNERELHDLSHYMSMDFATQRKHYMRVINWNKTLESTNRNISNLLQLDSSNSTVIVNAGNTVTTFTSL